MVHTYPQECVAPAVRSDGQVDIAVKVEAATERLYDAELAARFLTRTYTAAAELAVPGQVPPGRLLPAGMELVRSSVGAWTRTLVAESGGTAVVIRADARMTSVQMYASDTTELSRVWDSVRKLAHQSIQRGVNEVSATMWSYASGPRSHDEQVCTEPWRDVRRNYPNATASALDATMSLSKPSSGGRLLLWYGPSGTGKTSAVTTLMSAWSPWCDTHVITDPETFFGSPDYLMWVLQARQQPDLEAPLPAMDEARPMRWKLIVCEDADEYLRTDARRRSGPALGRLLNATDGILGRNSQSLILLTTNDDITRLHPALTRPGRCLSAVHFPPMSQTEAAAWCASTVPPPSRGATLAELFALAAGNGLIDADPAVGLYL